MRAAIVGALVGSFAAGAAFAKSEPVKPERPTIEARKKLPEIQRDCEPVVIKWWVTGPDGKLTLIGQQIVQDRNCHP